MKQPIIENELYLTAEYLSRKALCAEGVTVAGRHPLARVLAEVCKASLRPIPGDAMQEGLRELWYVLDLSDPDPDELKEVVDRCAEKKIPFLCIILLQNIKPNRTIHRCAEMELLTAMSGELSGVRRILSGYEKAKAIVLDRLIGAQFDGVGLSAIIKEAEAGVITVAQDAARRYFSFLYLPDALTAILTVSAKGKPGNLYNATSFYLSEFELRSRLYTMLAPSGVKLNVSGGAPDSEPSYAALSAGKLASLGWERVCSLDDVLRCTAGAYTDRYDLQSAYYADSYDGKLNILRQLQLDMLREIDRICRKHHIRYFLSGGSMLGAVRHGGYIPWDDDIDVAFLRKEYERFKAAAPAELDERFSYQSFTNGGGYHYFFDRITAKDTYFASKYSDGYEMPKGISADIFVYDTVPDSERAQRRHWKRLMHKRLLMNVRWKNEPRGEGVSRLIAKLLLPLLRLKSMDSYSASYDKAVRRYERRSSHTVMAPATDHKWHDCMPLEWFTQVVPCRFEDVDTFLPAGYDGFLKVWYGEDYMTLLPLALRTPTHDYYRLDVGSCADPDSDEHFGFAGELSLPSHR